MQRTTIILAAFTIATLTGCVTAKQFEELQTACDIIDKENTELRLNFQDSEIELTELRGQVKTCSEAREALAADTARMGADLAYAQTEIPRLRDLNKAVEDQSGGRLAKLIEENKVLLEDVGVMMEDLQAREDALLELEADLAERTADLALRSARVEELEELLAARERAAEVLRKRLESALLGFENSGLSVEQRDGKVYVSLEAELLFASGSAVVDEKGKGILGKLGSVIADQTDLEIIIEGHTDSDKMSRPSFPRNNWELSVLRATSVLEIISAQPGVDPSILTALVPWRIPPC